MVKVFLYIGSTKPVKARFAGEDGEILNVKEGDFILCP
jgi:hypothetical protein